MDLSLDRSDGNLTCVSLSGKLDYAGANEIWDKLRHLIDSCNTHFLVDMTKVSYVAERGIGLLFMGAKVLAREEKKLIVLNPQPMVEETLVESGTAKLIPIVRDREEVLRLLMLDAADQDAIA